MIFFKKIRRDESIVGTVLPLQWGKGCYTVNYKLKTYLVGGSGVFPDGLAGSRVRITKLNASGRTVEVEFLE